MAKDPAFLFYYQDFIVGTTFMSNAETGAYIRTLCHLADKGTITDVQITMLCEKDTDMAMAVMLKLKCISEGVYCSPRLTTEVEKRKAFAESRRKNRTKKEDKICKTYVRHMENENEDVNRDINKKEEKRKKEVLLKDSDTSISDIKTAFQNTQDLKQADAKYYYNVMLDWSDSKNTKRTDWIATARGFARRDLKDSKMKKVAYQKTETYFERQQRINQEKWESEDKQKQPQTISEILKQEK